VNAVTFWSPCDPFVTVAELVDRFQRDLEIPVRVLRDADDLDADGLDRVVGDALRVWPARGGGAVRLRVRYVEEADAWEYGQADLPGKPAFSELRVVATAEPVGPEGEDLLPAVIAVLATLYPGGVERWTGASRAWFGTDASGVLGTVEPAARRAAREEREAGWWSRARTWLGL
jgi:hypothetical protein